jgi:hypothetical protein
MMFRAWLKPRIFAASVVAALALVSSGRAQAQFLGTGGTGITTGTGGSTGAGTFSSSDFFIGVQQTPGVNLSAFDVARFFNQARCNCSAPVNLFIALQPQSVAKRTTVTNVQGNISVLLGPGCSDTQIEELGNCILLAQEPTLTFLNDTSYTIPTNARALSTYLSPTGLSFDAGTSLDSGLVQGTSTGACSATGQFDQTITVLVDFNGDTFTDVPGLSSSLLIDLSPPPQPTNVTIQGGDEALIMHWTAIDTSITTDLVGYQILCSRADKYRVFNENGTDGGASGNFGAGFDVCASLQPGKGADGSVESSSPTFVCSPLLSAEATSYRVEILQNDITYAASVVAVDNSGNASAPIVGYGTPIKTLSFYEVYRNGNPQDAGGASGGFCALATSRPRLTSTLGSLLALGLGAFGVIRARRRRGRR